jgi:replication factor A1
MRNKVSSSEYLAFLSMKYEVDADKFYEALISAGKSQKSTCGKLSIECRKEKKDGIVLLITKGPKVVAQFPLSREFLMERNNPIKDARRSTLSNRRTAKENGQLQPLQIKDLRSGMKKITLKAEIIEISEPSSVVTRFGNMANVANALVSDESGKIKLCLWNEQIGTVSVGDTVEIENASVSTFKGERQLRIGRKGVLRVSRNSAAN